MFTSIEEVPVEYRGMFYPPVIIDLNMDLDGTEEIRPDFFTFPDFRKKIEELNLAYFMGEFKDAPPIPDHIKILSRLKYAYIYEGESRHITYVDNETMKAYRMHDNSYYDGLLCPLQEITNFKFDRWCRGMDL